jgi:Leucine-rich repeat (LRR) protein
MASVQSFWRPAIGAPLVAVLAMLTLLSEGQTNGVAAFDSSFLQGCPEHNNITALDLAYNYGLAGPIPPEIGKCTSLVSLNISYNDDVSGQIPPELGNLSQLKELKLSGLGLLSGPFPSALCRLTKLEYLSLTGTNVSGPLPDCLGSLLTLKTLDLSGSPQLQSSGQTLEIACPILPILQL